MTLTATSTRTAANASANGTRAAERWGLVSGIVFVVFMVTGTYFVADFPAADATQQRLARYLTDGSNQTRNLAGAYVWVLGAILFLIFVTRLRAALRTADGGRSILPNIAFGAGILYSALMMVSAVTFASLAYTIKAQDGVVSNADFVRVIPQLAWIVLLLGAGFAGIVVTITSCIAGARTHLFPGWLVVLGILMSVALLFDIAYTNIVPFLIWVLAASITLLVRGDQSSRSSS